LLGTSHDYGGFDPELIERYVCLGDDDGIEEAGPSDAQGRFADITKAADLWLDRPDWPVSLCLRDTPGVNDTFMMREQITIGAIRDSRLCVVVLSAHQALSSVDMALIRLISNVRSREVIVFVNRVDELSNPSTQIPEIRQSIEATLEEHARDLGQVPILFGSARWATLALTGQLHEMDDEEAAVLLAHAEHSLPDLDEGLGPFALIWELSGLPALYGAIWERVAEGPAKERLQAAARATMNLAIGLSAAAEVDPLRAAAEGGEAVDAAALASDLDELERQVLEQFEQGFNFAYEGALARLERSQRSFLDRAVAALIKHLEAYGELAPWSYDPAGLRLLLRSGYQVFARHLRGAGEEAADSAAQGVAAIYARALGAQPGSFSVQPPIVPRLAAPVLLGQTIALDLQGTWWRRWWSRRRGYKSFAPEFHAMLDAETQPILEGMREGHLKPSGAAMRDALRRFFDDQRVLVAGLGQPGGAAEGLPDSASDARPSPERLSEAVDRLGRLAA
ncbi:MAG: hypothetical protein AAFR52_00825, partial [Pseudomonadota bacterium]